MTILTLARLRHLILSRVFLTCRNMRGIMAPAVSSLFIAVGIAFFGCGPITASTKISDARAELEKAKKVDAPKYAPFEYQGAVLYLEKAREEEGYACYQDAVELASTAFKWAADAQRQTEARKAELLEEARKAKQSKEASEAEQAK